MALDTSAPWWDPNAPQDGHPLVRHAPEDGQYYTPDNRQLEKMRSGRMPVVVPRARRDGAPPGFDPHQASVVHVDPDAPDGGVVVDTKQITRSAMDSAIQNARYPHQVYYQLGRPPEGQALRAPAVEEPRVNPVMPNAYVAPKAAQDGRQVTNLPPVQEAPMSTAPAPLPAPPPGLALTPSVFANQHQPPQPPPQQPQYQPPPQPQYAPQAQQYPAYQPPQPQYAPPPQNDMLAMLVQGQNQIAQGLANLGNLFQRSQMPTQPVEVDAAGGFRQNRDQVQPRPEYGGQRAVEAPPQRRNGRGGDTFEDDATPIGHRPTRKPPVQKQREDELRQVPQETRRQRYSDYLDEEPPADPVIAGFETLKIPYIVGPSPEKARVKVIFELPGRGKQMATYHGIEATKKCVVLTYDNRWEDGNPYMPPEPEEGEEHVEDLPIRLHVPSMKTTFTVYSVGMTFAHGVIDFIVLPLKEAEQLDYNGKG